MIKKLTAEQLGEIYPRLKQTEREIIALYYGVNNKPRLTVAEISQKLTISEPLVYRRIRDAHRKATTSLETVKPQLVELVEQLYGEGYQSGISGPDADKWFEAWAEVMFAVAHGKDDSVIKAFERLRKPR